MPAILNWLLRLLPTNPICMRLVQGGSRRVRHLYIRAGYLGVMIVVLLLTLLGSGGGAVGAPSVRELAAGGATMFQYVSYLQVILICLLAPIFMAGAIAQEANPRTWDILLTTPLNSLQIVLGNLFGRLFFIIALLFSSLPLFAMTQYFGGVPGHAIFSSYAIAGASALLVASIAITLSVTRTAGRRAVFLFYITVVMYLFVTYAIDLQLREAVGPAGQEFHTTVVTPLNPFLSLEVLLFNTYVPHDFTGEATAWLVDLWMMRPISAFVWLCVWTSVFLIAFSTLRVRVLGRVEGSVPWYRRLLGLGGKGGGERPGRTVWQNPIAWREAVARGKSVPAIIGRWGFAGLGILAALVLVTMYHTKLLNGAQLQMALVSIVGAEIVIITLAALNMSATAVSREREDGGLDIILTTPIQPGPYIAGKLRGLIQFLLPMLLVPIVTVAVMSLYVVNDGFGREGGVQVSVLIDNAVTDMPLMLPEAAMVLPIVLVSFVAFCVMVGLQWSIKSKGTIGSVIASVGIVFAIVSVLSLCGFAGGNSLGVMGAAFTAFSPLNLLLSLVYPARYIEDALRQSIPAGESGVIVGAIVAALCYAGLVYAMYTNMKRTFMMTVRKLAGTN